MFSNYFKTAFRHIFKNKTNSFIIVAGMGLGLSSCIILALFLQYELKWNASHSKADNIYRVLLKRTPEGKDPWFGQSGCPLLTSEITDKLAEVENSTRFWTPSLRVTNNEVSSFENCIFAEPSFFDIFDFNLIAGNFKNFNSGINSILINDKIAKKFFKDINPVGSILEIEIEGENRLFTVAGILESVRSNNTLTPEIIIPFEVIYDKMRQRYGDHWGVTFPNTYLLLRPDADPKLVERTIAERLQALNVSMESVNGLKEYKLQPFTRIHASFSNPEGFPTESNANGLIVLFAIAVTILVICCINFATLSIGSASGRIRETGVRKVLGAAKHNIIAQHWIETALLTTLSFFLALLIADMFLPLMENIINFENQIQFSSDQVILLFAFWLFVVIVMGTYPALVISNFPIINAFKGETKVGESKKFKRILLLIQFTLSISLVAGSMVMLQQMIYLQTKNLGFLPDQSIIIPVRGNNNEALNTISILRDEFSGDEDIISVTGSSCYFGFRWTTFDWFYDSQKYSGFNQCTVDYNFINTLDINIIEGRDFSDEIVSDSRRGVIVNEAFLKRLNWESGVGKQIPGDFDDNEIIGVTEDFNYNSLHQEIKPLILTLNPDLMTSCSSYNYFSQTGMNVSNVIIKISKNDLTKSLSKLEKFWNKNISPEYPFDFQFIDEQIQKHYKKELIWVKIVSIASMIAVIIAMMGVFGLTLIQIHRKIKEIGIRKVLGASTGDIMMLTVKEITVIVAVSSLFAWPVASIIMNNWLENFAYKVTISPLLLIGSGFLVLSIAWITVGRISYKAASTNPVESLRIE